MRSMRAPTPAVPPAARAGKASCARFRRHPTPLAEAAGGRVLVITHAGPMRAALALACGLPFANLWAFKIDPGTRITLAAGRDPGGSLWGEIVEVVQP